MTGRGFNRSYWKKNGSIIVTDRARSATQPVTYYRTELDSLDIAGINVPSRDIGGDYYDFIPIVEGHLGIVVADVAGKGIPASLIMASFRAFLRAEIRNNYSIHTIFAKVNNLLVEILKPHQFVTAFYGVLDLQRRRFTYSNAGHHPPLLLRQDGKWRQLKVGGLMLGTFENISYDEQFVDLSPGNLFVLYTDGLVEAENKAAKFSGANDSNAACGRMLIYRQRNCVRRLPPDAAFQQRAVRRRHDHCGG